ncbi:phospholipid-transporting ATPase IF-like [Penaeus japonicus]|uniref:phospholipid-transporting ATPase IF-like n=1 Tax=Penaeus japonicus TaxID=27405 RepID=UPI001C713495|nr:phospholipid-transporting ATPase IF-like [Penaeus japonicus]
MFLEWDNDLRCTITRERAKCNTSDLNEELGQVQYLFTDKTGTLTENIMHFRHCSVNGAKYIDAGGDIHAITERLNKTIPLPALPEALETFLETLALCHTVQVTTREKATGEVIATSDEMELAEMKLEYQAASPDEKALVEACARYGVVFEGQSHDQLVLDVRGQRRTFTRLQILEFDSDRKCMSVAVRDESTGRIWLLTKGAESSVLKRCSMKVKPIKAAQNLRVPTNETPINTAVQELDTTSEALQSNQNRAIFSPSGLIHLRKEKYPFPKSPGSFWSGAQPRRQESVVSLSRADAWVLLILTERIEGNLHLSFGTHGGNRRGNGHGDVTLDPP